MLHKFWWFIGTLYFFTPSPNLLSFHWNDSKRLQIFLAPLFILCRKWNIFAIEVLRISWANSKIEITQVDTWNNEITQKPTILNDFELNHLLSLPNKTLMLSYLIYNISTVVELLVKQMRQLHPQAFVRYKLIESRECPNLKADTQFFN